MGSKYLHHQRQGQNAACVFAGLQNMSIKIDSVQNISNVNF